jgi:hypothetical protein
MGVSKEEITVILEDMRRKFIRDKVLYAMNCLFLCCHVATRITTTLEHSKEPAQDMQSKIWLSPTLMHTRQGLDTDEESVNFFKELGIVLPVPFAKVKDDEGTLHPTTAESAAAAKPAGA